MAEDGGSSWDVVSDDDLISVGMEDDDYVVVREEDITDAIACFMVTYLSSLEQTKVRTYLVHLLLFYVSRQLISYIGCEDNLSFFVGYIT